MSYTTIPSVIEAIANFCVVVILGGMKAFVVEVTSRIALALGDATPMPTLPFPKTLNLVPPVNVYATPEAVPANAAVTKTVSLVMVVMALVSEPDVVVAVMVSPTLNVLVNWVPTPVTPVPEMDTEPIPVVD